MANQAVQVEIVATLGQFQAQMKAATDSLAQMSRTMAGLGGQAGPGLAEVGKASQHTERATQGLLGSAREIQKEARQAGRMSRFWASELTEIIPGAEGAAGALKGLIRVGAEGLIGGMGIGLVLASLKLLVDLYEHMGEKERKANAAADTLATSLGKQTADIWKNVDALKARNAHVLEFQIEADQKLGERREDLGGLSLLGKQAALRIEIAAAAERAAKARAAEIAYTAKQYDQDYTPERAQLAGEWADKSGPVRAAKGELLRLEQALAQVTQQVIAIEAERFEKSLAWAREYNAAQEKQTLDVEAEARRIGAASGSEKDRIQAEATNKRIELERKYREEQAKGTANAYAYDVAKANIDNEEAGRLRKLRDSTEAANAALAGQVRALEAVGDVERVVVAWETERARVLAARATGALAASTAQAQLNLADAQYLDGLKKIGAAEDKRRLDEAQARGLQDVLLEPNESTGQDLSKTPEQVNAQATKNATHALKAYNDVQRQAVEWSARWGDTLGNALGGLITGTQSLGQVFAQVGQQIVAQLVDIAIQAVTANAASAASGAASSQAAVPIIGPALGIAAMGAMLGAVLGLLGNIGARELGGSVWPGMTLVGENGPELLRLGAGQSGSITPNGALAFAAAGGGGGDQYVLNVNALDAGSFRGFLRSNAREVRAFMREESRGGRL